MVRIILFFFLITQASIQHSMHMHTFASLIAHNGDFPISHLTDHKNLLPTDIQNIRISGQNNLLINTTHPYNIVINLTHAQVTQTPALNEQTFWGADHLIELTKDAQDYYLHITSLTNHTLEHQLKLQEKPLELSINSNGKKVAIHDRQSLYVIHEDATQETIAEYDDMYHKETVLSWVNHDQLVTTICTESNHRDPYLKITRYDLSNHENKQIAQINVLSKNHYILTGNRIFYQSHDKRFYMYRIDTNQTRAIKHAQLFTTPGNQISYMHDYLIAKNPQQGTFIQSMQRPATIHTITKKRYDHMVMSETHDSCIYLDPEQMLVHQIYLPIATNDQARLEGVQLLEDQKKNKSLMQLLNHMCHHIARMNQLTLNEHQQIHLQTLAEKYPALYDSLKQLIQHAE